MHSSGYATERPTGLIKPSRCTMAAATAAHDGVAAVRLPLNRVQPYSINSAHMHAPSAGSVPYCLWNPVPVCPGVGVMVHEWGDPQHGRRGSSPSLAAYRLPLFSTCAILQCQGDSTVICNLAGPDSSHRQHCQHRRWCFAAHTARRIVLTPIRPMSQT